MIITDPALSTCIREASSKTDPTFSIVVPTYNRPEELKRCLNSIFSQTFQDFEIIVCDDASVVDYEDLFNKITDSRIRVYRLKVNSGPAAARNLGISLARGQYIAFLDDDDEYVGDILSRTLELFTSTAYEVDMTWCNVRIMKENDSGYEISESSYLANYPSKEMLQKKLFTIGIGYGTCFKTKCIRDIGGFNEGLTTVEDTELFLRFIFANFHPGIIAGIGVIVHDHGLSKITSLKNTQLNIKECEHLLSKYQRELQKHTHLYESLINHIHSAKTFIGLD